MAFLLVTAGLTKFEALRKPAARVPREETGRALAAAKMPRYIIAKAYG
jgi:hypothetical protein